MNFTVTELYNRIFSFVHEAARYALKKRQKGTRFSVKEKKIFEPDESTEKQIHTQCESKNMRYEMDEN